MITKHKGCLKKYLNLLRRRPIVCGLQLANIPITTSHSPYLILSMKASIRLSAVINLRGL